MLKKYTFHPKHWDPQVEVPFTYNFSPGLGTVTNPYHNLFLALAAATSNGNSYLDCTINIHLMGSSVHYITTTDNTYNQKWFLNS